MTRNVLVTAFAIAALIGIFAFQSINSPVPQRMLTANDRAAWGIGEDGTRIAPPPETIHITLK